MTFTLHGLMNLRSFAAREVTHSVDMLLTILLFFAALLYASVGHAGASGYLAAMAIAGVTPEVMRPTALVLNLLVGPIAFTRFSRAGHFSWDLFWPFALGSIPFAFVGGGLTLPGQWHRVLVGVVLFAAAARLMLERTMASPNPVRRVPLVPAVVAGALIGVLSGLTGTGGGIFLSPLLLFTGWAETRQTGGVSAAFIMVNSLAALAGNLAVLRGIPPTLPLWALVVVAGGLLGSELGSRRVATQTFRRLLGVVLMIAAVKLVFS